MEIFYYFSHHSVVITASGIPASINPVMKKTIFVDVIFPTNFEQLNTVYKQVAKESVYVIERDYFQSIDLALHEKPSSKNSLRTEKGSATNMLLLFKHLSQPVHR